MVLITWFFLSYIFGVSLGRFYIPGMLFLIFAIVSCLENKSMNTWTISLGTGPLPWRSLYMSDQYFLLLLSLSYRMFCDSLGEFEKSHTVIRYLKQIVLRSFHSSLPKRIETKSTKKTIQFFLNLIENLITVSKILLYLYR